MTNHQNPIPTSFWQTNWEAIQVKLQPLRERYHQFQSKYPKTTLGLKAGTGLFLFAFLLLFLLCSTVYFGAFGKLPTYPDLEAIQNHVASEVYSEDGVLLGKYYIENRTNADFEELSPNLINALVATEDARFFEHSGIDFRAWIRVFVRTILMRDQSGGGGSTLSQQLAKNLFPRQEFSILSMPVAKIKEMFIARRLERVYSKEALLNLYLNTVPFSGNIYGVKVATQRFFNTSPKDISVENAAVLVGMLKGNSIYNPIKYPERATRRRNVVLQQMVKYEYLNPIIFDSLKSKPIDLQYYQGNEQQVLGAYLLEHLRLELRDFLKGFKKPNGSPYNLYTDGLKIHTTLNAQMQRYAEEAMYEQMTRLQDAFNKHWKGRKGYGSDALLEQAKQNSTRYKKLKAKKHSEETIATHFDTPVPMNIFNWEDGTSVDTTLSPMDSLKYYLALLQAGFLAMEPQTGKVRAWVGGLNHRHFQYDHVKSRRQVGSTFKPVVYAQALRQGIPPCEYIDNLHTVYTQYENWEPRNSNGKYGGVYSMEGALSHSVNVVTVDLMIRSGIDSVRMLANEMGIDGEIPKGPATSLGTMNASLMEMLQVYGTIANGGKRPTMHYLSHIETAEGDTLFKFNPPNDTKPTLSKDVAAMMTQMLRSVVDSGTARRLRYQFRLYNEIAGKTGTTQQHSDGWFIGFTPNLVAGAWVGADFPQVRFRSMKLGQGGNTALPIWGRFMNKVYKDDDFKSWKKLKFPPLDTAILAQLDCPPYLEDRVLLEPEGEYEEDEVDEFFDWVEGFFKKNQQKQVRTQSPEQRKRSAEIRRNNEKLEKKRARKKKRKKLFDGALKRKN